MDNLLADISFPYTSLRKGQEDFIKKVHESIKQNKNLLVSAPTGLGKTISALAPAIHIAKEKNLSVVFLTSRQTQANQAIKTIKDISSKSKHKINYVSFIGKRNMCYHEERDLYPAVDFNDFCKKAREEGKCKFYKNTKNEDNEDHIKAIIGEASNSFMSVEGFVNLAGNNGFCPYELAGFKSFKSDVIICDFNYLFKEGIRENFLGKIGRPLEECIVIVDEAHNLPDRVRNSNSYVITNQILKNAIKELTDFVKSSEYDDYVHNVKKTIEDIYFDKVLGEKKDYILSKEEFTELFLSKFDQNKVTYSLIFDKLREVEAKVKEDRVISFVGRVANFLEKWEESQGESYIRVIEKEVKQNKTILSLKIKCIDSSDFASEVLNNSLSSILMSATLSPINMYKDILGVENCSTMELDSPFAKENQLTLVIDDVTSKYTARSEDMYKRIAQHIKDVLIEIPDKNAIFFFPSYDFQNRVTSHLSVSTLGRVILKEQKLMSKEDKEKIVEKFKETSGFQALKPKVLFGITGGSFAEGLDLPSNALELVGIIGLPLSVPDTFTQAVIRHYDKKFKKGQMYGYVYPAMSKIIQAAGRCIRTETDRGVVLLMDSRYIFPQYALCFPKHWNLHVPQTPVKEIEEFFS